MVNSTDLTAPTQELERIADRRQKRTQQFSIALSQLCFSSPAVRLWDFELDAQVELPRFTWKFETIERPRNHKFNLDMAMQFVRSSTITMTPSPVSTWPSPVLKANYEREAEAFLTKLQEARQLEQHGHEHDALDLLYDLVDEYISMRWFDALDYCLDRIRTEELSVNLMLGLLTTTRTARSNLSQRESFLAKVEESLKKLGKYREGLLDKLKG